MDENMDIDSFLLGLKLGMEYVLLDKNVDHDADYVKISVGSVVEALTTIINEEDEEDGKTVL